MSKKGRSESELMDLLGETLEAVELAEIVSQIRLVKAVEGVQLDWGKIGSRMVKQWLRALREELGEEAYDSFRKGILEAVAD